MVEGRQGWGMDKPSVGEPRRAKARTTAGSVAGTACNTFAAPVFIVLLNILWYNGLSRCAI